MAKKLSKNKLSALEECCCRHFIANGGDQSKAYRECHNVSKRWKNKTIWEKASRLFAQDKVKTRIEVLQAKSAEKLLISDKSVLKQYARIGFSDPRKLFDEDGQLKNIQEIDDDTAAAIQGINVIHLKKGGIKIEYKMCRKNPALDSLSKNLGLFEKDNGQKKKEINITVINPILAGMVDDINEQIERDAE